MPVIHPANQQIWELFQIVLTQIRVGGMGEFVGCDFSLLPTLLRAYDVPVSAWAEYIEGFTVLNSVAVKIAREQAEEQSKKNP